MRLPESVLLQTVTGDFVEDEIYYDLLDPADIDMLCRPDSTAIYPVPWALEPTAIVIHDTFDKQGNPIELSPRNFDPLFEDVYDWCEAQGLDLDTLIHEDGPAQMEINFRHGDALDLADQITVFKRTMREAALKHNVTATFMAKPHIGGLQKYIPKVLPMFAPNVNSFRRFLPDTSAPVNVEWGEENRTVGLRVPTSSPESMRVENRLPGADANPYLAIAASLLCGYLGMVEGIAPSAPVQRSEERFSRNAE
uniref:Gln-synt_C domain-containing protein n=1 Tax=Steinernema glaseri TaxID=37863 RepID=A0A1I8AMX0_9BILA